MSQEKKKILLDVRTTKGSQEWLVENSHVIMKVSALMTGAKYSASNAVLGKTVGTMYPIRQYLDDPLLECFRVVLAEYSFPVEKDGDESGQDQQESISNKASNSSSSSSNNNEIFTVEFVADRRTILKLAADMKKSGVKLVIGGIFAVINDSPDLETSKPIGQPSKRTVNISPNPKVIQAEYGLAVIWVVEDDPLVIKSLQSAYNYTLLKDLADGSSVNIYGVIVGCEFPAPKNGDWIIRLKITDESIGPEDHTIVILKGTANDRKPEIKRKYDIIRLHRVTINSSFADRPVLQAFGRIGSRGFHCCVFDGTHGAGFKPLSKTSEEYTMTDSDSYKISELRDWIISSNMVMSDDGAFGEGGRKLGFDGVKNLCDMTPLSYFNIVGQVLGIYAMAKDCLVVRIWDGTAPQLSLIALEDTDTAGVCRVYAENLLSTAVLKATGQKLFVDVFAYNDQSEKIKSLKIWPGDYVKFTNVHSYAPGGMGKAVVKQSLTLHQGGMQYGRKCERIDPSTPLGIKMTWCLANYQPPSELQIEVRHGNNEFLAHLFDLVVDRQNEASFVGATATNMDEKRAAQTRTSPQSSTGETSFDTAVSEFLDERYTLGVFAISESLDFAQMSSAYFFDDENCSFEEVEYSQPAYIRQINSSPQNPPIGQSQQTSDVEMSPAQQTVASPMNILKMIDAQTTVSRQPPVRDGSISPKSLMNERQEKEATCTVTDCASNGAQETNAAIQVETDETQLPEPMEAETDANITVNNNIMIKKEVMTPSPSGSDPSESEREEATVSKPVYNFISMEDLATLSPGEHTVHLKPLDFMPFFDDAAHSYDLLAWWCEKCEQYWLPFTKDDEDEDRPFCAICQNEDVKNEMSVVFRFYLLLNEERNVGVVVTGPAAADFLSIPVMSYLRAIRKNETWPIQSSMRKLSDAVKKGVKVPLRVDFAFNNQRKRVYHCY